MHSLLSPNFLPVALVAITTFASKAEATGLPTGLAVAKRYDRCLSQADCFVHMACSAIIFELFRVSLLADLEFSRIALHMHFEIEFYTTNVPFPFS